MAFASALVELHLGNVESRLVGPFPRQTLDRALNPHLRGAAEPAVTAGPEPAAVLDPRSGVFLTGALGAAKRALRRGGFALRVRDLRWAREARPGWAVRGFELHPYQHEVVARALACGSGLVDVGTSGGKTLLAATLIARLGLPTLYLVTTRTLLRQTVRSLTTMLGVEPGVVGDGVSRPERLTVALVQALPPEATALAPWRGGALVFDEGHHAAASTYQELIRRLEPRYHYYLSAVPFRSGADQVVLDALVGRGGRLTGGRFSAAYLVDHGYACPVELSIQRVSTSADVREKPFATVYRECVVDNRERNLKVAGVVREAAATRRPALVLVEHVRHGRRLLELLGEGATFVHGGTPRRALHAATERFAAGATPCLVATSGLFAEGVSIEGIEVLVQAGGLRSRAKVIQAVGRGMRRAPGKASCLYVDFFDDDPLGVLRRHSRARLAVLQQEGFAVPRLEVGRDDGGVDDDIPPLWSHVPDTRRFVLVDGDGALRGRAECLRREMVPDRFCRKCRQTELCRNGGRILWRDDQV